MTPTPETMGRSWEYKNISTSTTTAVKTTPGMLHSVVVNAPGTTWSVALMDGTTVIATIEPVSGFLLYDVAFNALSVVTTGATPGDLTICYR